MARSNATAYNRFRMNAPISQDTRSGAGHEEQDVDKTSCFHCNLPVTDPARYGVMVDGKWRPVCCPGCEAVANAILGYGLQGYYEHRTDPAPTAQTEGESRDLGIYDDPEVQRGFVHAAPNGECDAALMIEGVRCTACVWLNQSVLERLPGVSRIGINARAK